MRTLLALIIAVAPASVFAGFYTWFDPDGVRHVSTHPQSCFPDGKINLRLPGCGPIVLSEAESQFYEFRQREKKRAADAKAAQAKCAELELRRTTLRKSIRSDQSQMKDNVIALALGRVPAGMDIDYLVGMPIRNSLNRQELLAAERAYDECVPEHLRAERKRKRASRLRAMEERALQLKIQSDLDEIKSKLNVIR